jgi:hypothetical protein
MAYGLLRREEFRGRQVEVKAVLAGLGLWRQSTASIESFPFAKYPKLFIGHSGEHFRSPDCGGSRGSSSPPAGMGCRCARQPHGTIGFWVEPDRPNQHDCHPFQTAKRTEKSRGVEDRVRAISLPVTRRNPCNRLQITCNHFHVGRLVVAS